MNTLYFPLVVASGRKSIKLSSSARLIRFDNRTVANLVGVRHIVLSDTGLIREIGFRDDAQWYAWAQHMYPPMRFAPFNVYKLNFVLSVATREEAVNVAFAMKLLAGTLSGPYIGFSDFRQLPSTVQFLNISPYWGGSFISLGTRDISLLRTLLAALNAHPKGGKMETIIEKYRYAESADVPSQSLRFLELAVILEMLFLPTADRELAYRFQLRVAKWFNRHYGDDIEDIATTAKRIYKLRSDIAHSGTGKISDKDLIDARHITRMALRSFVLDASIFTDKYLDELCLRG